MTDFIIKIAETEEEKIGAFQVRFQCLTLENGDTSHANFEKQIFTDSKDNSDSSQLLVAIDAGTGKVCATERIVFRYKEPFIADEIYPFDELAKHLNVDVAEEKNRAVLHDRSSVLPEYRNVKPSLFGRIWNLCEATAKTRIKDPIMVGFVNQNNLAFIKTLTDRMAMRVLCNELIYKDKRFCFLFKVL